ncbi:MAG: hypothetical protein K2N73_10150 [Lachnospiraceae bacterium]|nr:hypothetical protein [Lachnospiraceae bacterium]
MEFKTVLKELKKSEKRKDKFLKAAKLQRCEKQGLSEETVFAMFCLLLCFGLMAALFIFG